MRYNSWVSKKGTVSFLKPGSLHYLKSNPCYIFINTAMLSVHEHCTWINTYNNVRHLALSSEEKPIGDSIQPLECGKRDPLTISSTGSGRCPFPASVILLLSLHKLYYSYYTFEQHCKKYKINCPYKMIWNGTHHGVLEWDWIHLIRKSLDIHFLRSMYILKPWIISKSTPSVPN